MPMETRGVVAAPDPITRGLTFWTSNQGPHGFRNEIAAALGLGQNQVRAIAPEVGGGFGCKFGAYPEDFIAAALAIMLHRPVKWIETRSENFLATNHGRNQWGEFEAGADRDGKIQALRARILLDSGAYPKALDLAWCTWVMSTGPYEVPNLDYVVEGVYTNTMANGAYRGAGRPEATFYLERLMDLIADEGGLDPAEVRRANFIPPDSFPYTTLSGEHYDTGEYAKPLDGRWSSSATTRCGKEQAALRKAGALPRHRPGLLRRDLRLRAVGERDRARRAGRRGHDLHRHFPARAGAGDDLRPARRRLPRRRFRQGRRPPRRHRQHAARQRHRRQPRPGRRRRGAGPLAQQGPRQGAGASPRTRWRRPSRTSSWPTASYRVRGVPAGGLTLAEVAKAAYGGGLPADIDAGLEATEFFKPTDETFPFGTHIAVVEVFPETGQVQLLRYLSVDDCGTIISPMLVTGQVHGGLAQGIGQALWEEMRYDDGGELLTGTLNDYALPKADGFPRFETHHTTTTTPINPLGAKGIGEAATIGSTPTVANAVIDALSAFGITHLDIPFTPEKVWRAIHEAQNGGSGE